MHRIIESLRRHEPILIGSPLCKWLGDEQVPGNTRLKFAPAMIHYVMGFPDILETLARDFAKDPVSLHVVQYCKEDASHWRWYLQDLQKLGFSTATWGDSVFRLWQTLRESGSADRRLVSDLTFSARSARDPFEKVAIVLVIEAAGRIFLAHTLKAAIAGGMGEQLLYFGRRHYEEELEHSLTEKTFGDVRLESASVGRADAMIERLFASYRSAFDSWFAQRDRFSNASSARVAGAD